MQIATGVNLRGNNCVSPTFIGDKGEMSVAKNLKNLGKVQ